jgi:hypothetical protein
MYSDWPQGTASFKDEFDPAFAALGWQVTKFVNTQAKELSQQLGSFDIVVGGGVSNYSNPQDFSPYAAQWQAFLQGGGVVVATDASIQFKVLEHPELWAMLKQLTSEVTILMPTLLNPASDGKRFADGSDGCLRGTAITLGSELTILAAHTNNKDLGQQELCVPGLPAAGKAEVLFEDRSVDVVAGKIRDLFAPYAVHVYRIKL